MALVDFHADLRRTNELLERIAYALERAAGPDLGLIGPVEYKNRKRGPEAITNYGNNERIWLKDNFANLIREKGLAPAQEQEILDEAMKDYDQSVEKQAMGEVLDEELW